jgi:predicted enzyme related to lactoylglutathione lyase
MAEHGRFVWYELSTTDQPAARKFYTDVVGWGAEEAQMPGMTYTMFKQADLAVAGMAPLQEQAKKMGVPPNWMGYVGVDDVDATAAKAKSLGGSVHVGPMDIPNVGRFAVLGDPQNAVIAVFKWQSDPGIPLPAMGAPGRVAWHELYCADYKKELEFYERLFGWKAGNAMDMGAMGIYQIFNHGPTSLGGMMNKPPQVPVNFWLYYIGVNDIDVATDRVKKGGGNVVVGPMQVPGGDWIIQGTDPQGAYFALFGKKK